MNKAREENRFHLEGKIALYICSIIIVQKAIRAGEEAKLFTEIQNVRCENRESNKKDNKKKRFPFME